MDVGSCALIQEDCIVKCSFTDCPNEATTVVYRHATEDEQVLRFSDGVSTYAALFQIEVCDSHLETAQKEYPYIRNEEA